MISRITIIVSVQKVKVITKDIFHRNKGGNGIFPPLTRLPPVIHPYLPSFFEGIPIIYFFLFFFLVSCQEEPPNRSIQPAFYHWQTQLKIDSIEANYMESLRTKRLYVKFFDVDWNASQQQAVPKASLHIVNEDARYSNLNQLDIIPTIFITNRTFKALSAAASDELSARIWDKIQRIMPTVDFKEIQFDCDWTLSTKEAYFQFLNTSRRYIPKHINLSATIRLHQYRYPEKTGIPPADRGMLMFYNMGDLEDWEEPNSILNIEKATPYLLGGIYPIPLDIALPIFQWGVLFREGKMIKLINGLDEKRLLDSDFYQALLPQDSLYGTSRYRLKKSTYLDGYYLYEGDEIRLESICDENLWKASHLLQKVINSDTSWLSFYHLSAPLLEAYEYNVFEKCVEILSNPNNKLE